MTPTPESGTCGIAPAGRRVRIMVTMPGEAVDDGKIGDIIRGVTRDLIEIAVTHARAGGSKLGADKGINLPDSVLRLPDASAQENRDAPRASTRGVFLRP